MAEMETQKVVEIWAETAFDAWIDEDAVIFESIKKKDPTAFELVKQAFLVGFVMGGGAVLGEGHDELIDALQDLE